VLGHAQAAKDFLLSTSNGSIPALDILTQGTYHREFTDNEEKSEYFVPIQWLDTKPFDQAVQELGMFGNQNTVCKPTAQKWRSTVDRLKLSFPKFNELKV